MGAHWFEVDSRYAKCVRIAVCTKIIIWRKISER